MRISIAKFAGKNGGNGFYSVSLSAQDREGKWARMFVTNVDASLGEARAKARGANVLRELADDLEFVQVRDLTAPKPGQPASEEPDVS